MILAVVDLSIPVEIAGVVGLLVALVAVWPRSREKVEINQVMTHYDKPSSDEQRA